MATSIDDGSNNHPFTLIWSTGRKDHPELEKHRCAYMATIMAEIHNVIIRALNSAYANAGNVKPGTKEAADLLQYSQIICEMIQTHHDWEETSYYPAVEAFAKQPGILQQNIEQHQAFEEGVHKFHEYCKGASKAEYTTVDFRTLINKFSQPLNRHFHEEPALFYSLGHLDSEGLDRVFLEQEKIVLAKADPWKFMPLLLGNMGKGDIVDELPKSLHDQHLPWFLPYLSYYVFSWRYGGAWKFTSTDFWGNLKSTKM